MQINPTLHRSPDPGISSSLEGEICPLYIYIYRCCFQIAQMPFFFFEIKKLLPLFTYWARFSSSSMLPLRTTGCRMLQVSLSLKSSSISSSSSFPWLCWFCRYKICFFFSFKEPNKPSSFPFLYSSGFGHRPAYYGLIHMLFLLGLGLVNTRPCPFELQPSKEP